MSTLKISVIIPAHNEEECLEETTRSVIGKLRGRKIPYEIVLVNDNSTDRTGDVIRALEKEDACIRGIHRTGLPGFGRAVKSGLDSFTGDIAVIMMADASDDPQDLISYYDIIAGGADCAFGSRFVSGSTVKNYPVLKKILNRAANMFIRLLFGLRYNDVTNAFKAYTRETINGVRPLLSAHFNMTVELPLKAIVRGFRYETLPINWHGRETGVSKLKIKEMGSRYIFIIIYVLLEKWLTGSDYRRSKKDSLEKKR